MYRTSALPNLDRYLCLYYMIIKREDMLKSIIFLYYCDVYIVSLLITEISKEITESSTGTFSLMQYIFTSKGMLLLLL